MNLQKLTQNVLIFILFFSIKPEIIKHSLSRLKNVLNTLSTCARNLQVYKVVEFKYLIFHEF